MFSKVIEKDGKAGKFDKSGKAGGKFDKSGKAGGKFDKSEKKEKKDKGGDVVRFQKLNKLYNDLMAKKEKTDKVKKGVVDEILKIASGVLVQVRVVMILMS